jgi:hypothetical protein
MAHYLMFPSSGLPGMNAMPGIEAIPIQIGITYDPCDGELELRFVLY